MKYLQIDVYEYGTNCFLGQRFAPYREFKQGEKIISNHEEINNQVGEVKILQNKKEVYFKTKVVV
jgi:hypothetical protein